MKNNLRSIRWTIPIGVGLMAAIIAFRSYRQCIEPEFIAGEFPFVYSAFVFFIGLIIAGLFKEISAKRILFCFGLAIGCFFITSFTLINVLGPGSVGSQLRTMQRMVVVDKILQQIDRTFSMTPLSSLPESREREKQGLKLPVDDGWGYPIQVQKVAGKRFVLSGGACGNIEENRIDEERINVTYGIEEDIIMKDGKFIKYPENMARLFKSKFPGSLGIDD